MYPGKGRLDAMLQRGRQPSFGTLAIEKARGAIAQRRTATAAHLTPCRERLRDLPPSMHEFGQPQHMRLARTFSGFFLDRFGLTHHGNTRRAASRIDLDAKRLQDAFFLRSIDQADGKGHEPMHPRPARAREAAPAFAYMA